MHVIKQTPHFILLFLPKTCLPNFSKQCNLHLNAISPLLFTTQVKPRIGLMRLPGSKQPISVHSWDSWAVLWAHLNVWWVISRVCAVRYRDLTLCTAWTHMALVSPEHVCLLCTCHYRWYCPWLLAVQLLFIFLHSVAHPDELSSQPIWLEVLARVGSVAVIFRSIRS